jgi:DNA mismatch endonuclease Vsr
MVTWTSTPEWQHLARRKKVHTEPELLLRSALHAAGARFHLHRRLADGCTPDLVLPRHRVAVFVDGDYWHSCPVHGRQRPFTGPNAALWEEKMRRTRSAMSGRLRSPMVLAGRLSGFGNARFGPARMPRLKPCLRGALFHRSQRQRDLGLTANLTRSTGGVSSASTSSTVIVSVAVRWPAASSVILDTGISLLSGSPAPAVWAH